MDSYFIFIVSLSCIWDKDLSVVKELIWTPTLRRPRSKRLAAKGSIAPLEVTYETQLKDTCPILYFSLTENLCATIKSITVSVFRSMMKYIQYLANFPKKSLFRHNANLMVNICQFEEHKSECHSRTMISKSVKIEIFKKDYLENWICHHPPIWASLYH